MKKLKTTPIVAGLSLLVGLAALGGIVFVLIFPPTGCAGFSAEPDSEISLLGGEVGTTYGFGDSRAPIGSPGPELRVKQGEVVGLSFLNDGAIPHTFRVVTEQDFEDGVFNPEAVFCATIGSPADPLTPGERGTTNFLADKADTFYYICTVPGHVDLGMFGKLVVEP